MTFIQLLAETVQTSQILDVLKDIRNEIAIQNSIQSQITHHAIDFFVILVADIGAAVFAIVTFEAWKEKDRTNKERATSILSMLGKYIPKVIYRIEIIEKSLRNSGTSTFTSSPDQLSEIRELFAEKALEHEVLDWEYPGGSDLKYYLAVFKQAVKAINGPTINGSSLGELQVIFEDAKAIEYIRKGQVGIYARAKVGIAWGRFYNWVLGNIKGSTLWIAVQLSPFMIFGSSDARKSKLQIRKVLLEVAADKSKNQLAQIVKIYNVIHSDIVGASGGSTNPLRTIRSAVEQGQKSFSKQGSFSQWEGWGTVTIAQNQLRFKIELLALCREVLDRSEGKVWGSSARAI